MNNPFDQNQDYSGGAVSMPGAIAHERTFVARVYGIMFIGVALTAISAWLASTPALLGNWFYTATEDGGLTRSPAFIGSTIGVLVIWLVFVFASSSLNSVVATILFLAYSILNGVWLSVALIVFTTGSVVAAFLVSAGLFGIFALYGHFTQRDLTSIGSLCLMGFVGLILASIVNFFLASNSMSWIITYVSVPIFIGLVAWQAQDIKQHAMLGLEGTEQDRHSAVMCALGLYIQFINILWALIRIFGRRD